MKRVGEVLLLSIVGAAVATVIWASRRGFDLTDEGYYLQLYARPQEGPPPGSSQFHLVVDLFNGGGDPGIVTYRLVGLALLMGAAALLATSIFAALREFQPPAYRTIPSRTAATAFVIVAGLLGYALLPLTLSYNTLSAVLAQTALALAVLSLSMRRTGSIPRAVILEVLAGASMLLLLFVKWPTAVLTLPLILVVSVGLVGWRKALRPMFVMVGSLVAWLCIVQVAGWFSLEGLISGSRSAASASHDPGALLTRYLSDLRSLIAAFRDAPLRLLALVALLSGGLLKSRRGARSKRILSLIAPAGGLYLLWEVREAGYLARTSAEMFVVSLIVAASLTALLAVVSNREPRSESSFTVSPAAWLAASLLVVPLAVSVGTNNQMFRASLVGAAGYGGFLVVILAVIGTRVKGLSALHYTLALPVLSFVLAAQVFNGVVTDPYRLPTPRTEQTEPVLGVERLEGILLDPQGKRFIEEVHTVVYERTAYQAGDRIVAFAKLPGLVYLLDGVGPGDLWINAPETGRQAADCEELGRDAANVASTKLILQNDEPSPELRRCLDELIPGYPDGFVEVARISLPGAYGAGTGSGRVLEVLELQD